MEVSTMRQVDRWAGTCLCIFLTLVRKVMDGAKAPPEGPPKKILFVKLAEQGSTVLAYPAILRAQEMVGRENVYFLVFKENRFILDVMEALPEENVIAIDASSLGSVIKSSLAAVHRMRKLKIDAAIDMEFFARSSSIFTFLSSAGHRVGFHAFAGDGPYRGDLMTHRLVYNPHLHTSQTFWTMVEALNQPKDHFPAFAFEAPAYPLEPLPTFTPKESEVEEVSALLRELFGKEEVPPLILLNANCSDLLPIRKWDNDNYVVLANRLLERYPDVHIAFTGAPKEAPEVVKLMAKIDSERCVCLAGRTTLRQLLVAYSLSQVLITNDSGPAHFSTLTPIDVITLFGPETPKLFCSPSPRSHIVWANTVCSPCVNAYNNRLSKCRHNVCMQRITVDQVFEKACEVYEQRVQIAMP
jgi:ADP-heptose:LPS heptosyltransferase